MCEILLIIFFIIFCVLILNYYNLYEIEKFKNNNSSSSNNKNTYNKKNTFVNPKDKIKLGLSEPHKNFYLTKNFIRGQQNQKQLDYLQQKVLFNNKNYNDNLSIDNKDNQYFYTDMIDQSNVNETAFNIVYSIDPIDYANVKTGLEKCNEQCNGVCFENGYNGIATCFPHQRTSFDWGTLYKNPSFTYGNSAPDTLHNCKTIYKN